jgi:shikimate kinase
MHNIVLVGFMATGKSTVGRALSHRLSFRVVDTDDMIEAKAGKPISQIFADDGEAAFRDLEAEAAREVASLSRHVIITGGGIVLRHANMDALKQAGPVFCLTASAEEILRRTEGTTHRPLLQTADPLATIRELLDARAPLYAAADHTIETTGLRADAVVARILEIVTIHHPGIVRRLG